MLCLFAKYFSRHHKAASPHHMNINGRHEWIWLWYTIHINFWIFNRNGNVIKLTYLTEFQTLFKRHKRSMCLCIFIGYYSNSKLSVCRRHWYISVFLVSFRKLYAYHITILYTYTYTARLFYFSPINQISRLTWKEKKKKSLISCSSS